MLEKLSIMIDDWLLKLRSVKHVIVIVDRKRENNFVPVCTHDGVNHQT